jgi:transketolase
MKKLRQEFADTMLEVGVLDKRLVVMVGDISHGLLQPYANACKKRYYNVGICEPTIVNMAAGISKCGLIPVVHTIAPFIIERAYEQIKLDFGYQDLSVNLVSVGSAFDYAQLGCSHHCYTDISLMGHLKKANIFFPSSPIEFNLLFKQVYQNNSINYFRLPESTHDHKFELKDIRVGKGIQLTSGDDLTILVVGPQLRSVLDALPRLREFGIGTEVLYYPTIKPFDFEMLYKSANKTKNLLVVEEASSHDGVTSYALKATYTINDMNLHSISIDDFIHGYGTYSQLCKRLGFTSEGVFKKIVNCFSNLIAEKVGN